MTSILVMKSCIPLALIGKLKSMPDTRRSVNILQLIPKEDKDVLVK